MIGWRRLLSLMADTTSPNAELVAVLDMGASAIRLVVAEVDPGGTPGVVEEVSRGVLLGRDTFSAGRIRAETIDAALVALDGFHTIMQRYGVSRVRAVATSAVREAENGADFMTAARRDVGLRVRVISGTEEARLIHLAAGYAIGIRRQRAVVIDIGGGSTEITLGTAARMELGQSFKLGSIRLTEGFAKHDPLSKADERAIEEHVARETKAHLKEIRKRGFD